MSTHHERRRVRDNSRSTDSHIEHSGSSRTRDSSERDDRQSGGRSREEAGHVEVSNYHEQRCSLSLSIRIDRRQRVGERDTGEQVQGVQSEAITPPKHVVFYTFFMIQSAPFPERCTSKQARIVKEQKRFHLSLIVVREPIGKDARRGDQTW